MKSSVLLEFCRNLFAPVLPLLGQREDLGSDARHSKKSSNISLTASIANCKVSSVFPPDHGAVVVGFQLLEAFKR